MLEKKLNKKYNKDDYWDERGKHWPALDGKTGRERYLASKRISSTKIFKAVLIALFLIAAVIAQQEGPRFLTSYFGDNEELTADDLAPLGLPEEYDSD